MCLSNNRFVCGYWRHWAEMTKNFFHCCFYSVSVLPFSSCRASWMFLWMTTSFQCLSKLCLIRVHNLSNRYVILKIPIFTWNRFTFLVELLPNYPFFQHGSLCWRQLTGSYSCLLLQKYLRNCYFATVWLFQVSTGWQTSAFAFWRILVGHRRLWTQELESCL